MFSDKLQLYIFLVFDTILFFNSDKKKGKKRYKQKYQKRMLQT